MSNVLPPQLGRKRIGIALLLMIPVSIVVGFVYFVVVFVLVSPLGYVLTEEFDTDFLPSLLNDTELGWCSCSLSV